MLTSLFEFLLASFVTSRTLESKDLVLFRVFHSCWNIVMNASNEWTIYDKICQRGNKTLATKTSLKFKKIKALLLSQYCTMKFNLLEIRALSYNTVGFAILL